MLSLLLDSWILGISLSRGFRLHYTNIWDFSDLSGQDLTGSIPPEIGNLSHLESLNLSSNSLVGSIPNTFVKLSQLSVLKLCDNKLEGPLPKFLPELKSLRSLYLCNNLFSESIPPEIGGCPKLEFL
ncbi:receptor-like protein 7 [Coffea eugenioides]|uniref:receptor-like protein 7 n=1 Tax=Coffea eugenioides TaxID=49369 RepID=UPI000F60E6D3|nr:receptor-like protein 7 [Coffea eugenioides]